MWYNKCLKYTEIFEYKKIVCCLYQLIISWLKYLFTDYGCNRENCIENGRIWQIWIRFVIKIAGGDCRWPFYSGCAKVRLCAKIAAHFIFIFRFIHYFVFVVSDPLFPLFRRRLFQLRNKASQHTTPLSAQKYEKKTNVDATICDFHRTTKISFCEWKFQKNKNSY